MDCVRARQVGTRVAELGVSELVRRIEPSSSAGSLSSSDAPSTSKRTTSSELRFPNASRTSAFTQCWVPTSFVDDFGVRASVAGSPGCQSFVASSKGSPGSCWPAPTRGRIERVGEGVDRVEARLRARVAELGDSALVRDLDPCFSAVPGSAGRSR